MTAAVSAPAAPSGMGRKILTSLLRQPAGVIGLALSVLFVLMAVIGPALVPHNPLATDTANILAGPSSGHILGTDETGRDVFSRIVAATRPALLVGFAAVLVAGGIGTALGALSGYYRGIVDVVVMRVCDVLFAFPNILLGICAVVVLGPGVASVAVAVGIGSAPMFARLARAEVLDKLARDYVTVSRGLGGKDAHIVGRHVLPNIATTMIVQAASAISSAVVFAAALDFIGLGSQPPDPSWGAMLQSSRAYLATAPLFAIAPGVVITAFVLGVNLLAGALANSLDPKIRTRILNASHPVRVQAVRTVGAQR